MSWWRRFLWAFWLFVGIMGLWEFYQYDQKLSTPDPEHPRQDHFFFYQQTKEQIAAKADEHEGPYLEQTSFTVSNDTPTSATFTCHVTLKNSGQAKAINVQVRVRPFRGIAKGDENYGHYVPGQIDENSILSQFGQWAEFPDLDPGQTCTEDVIFTKQPTTTYGNNPSPEIVFQPEKKH